MIRPLTGSITGLTAVHTQGIHTNIILTTNPTLRSTDTHRHIRLHSNMHRHILLHSDMIRHTLFRIDITRRLPWKATDRWTNLRFLSMRRP